MKWRWKYFSPEEVLSPSGLQKYRNRNTIKLQGYALDNLESLREYVSNPILCNHAGLGLRGYRSTKENKDAGGIIDSQHVQGIAFDLSCYSIGNQNFLSLIISHAKREINHNIGNMHKGVRGLGIYVHKNFFHVDYRTLLSKHEDYIVVWNGKNNASVILDKSILAMDTKDILIYLKDKLRINKWRK